MFWDECFLFLNNPRGGVEDIGYLKSNAPWVKGVLLNVRDYTPAEWEATEVQEGCDRHGLWYGPWGRTTDSHEQFSEDMVDHILDTKVHWGSPVACINCEKEIDGHQEHLDYVVIESEGHNVALSVQPIPFANLNWSVIKNRPILAQIMPQDQGVHHIEIAVRDLWWMRGAKIVYITYGTWGTQSPDDFPLRAAYSLFTGDPLMATRTVETWAPTSTDWVAVKPTPPTPEEPIVAVGVGKSGRLAYTAIMQSDAAKVWAKANPGENAKVVNYFKSAPDTEPPTVGTKFGNGMIHLIDAIKYAEGTHA
jgi:hypothetical protein